MSPPQLPIDSIVLRPSVSLAPHLEPCGGHLSGLAKLIPRVTVGSAMNGGLGVCRCLRGIRFIDTHRS